MTVLPLTCEILLLKRTSLQLMEIKMKEELVNCCEN